MRLKRDGEAIFVGRLAHRLQAVRHAFGIAVLAAGTDLGATGHGVPGGFGPFDGGFGGHGERLSGGKINSVHASKR